MDLEINTPMGGCKSKPQNKNKDNTTLSYSVAVNNSGQGYFRDQQTTQELHQLLREHVERLRVALSRSEAISVKPFPRYMNQKEVISYLGHERVFRILVEEFGLTPIREEHKCNVYCSKQVEEKCIQFELNIAA